MAIKCKIGFHSWIGCKCSKCGINRDEHHAWDGGKCTTCGKTRDEVHNCSNENDHDRSQSLSEQQIKPAPVNPNVEKGDGWYFAEDVTRGLRQFVFTSKDKLTTPSRFKSTFTFPGEFKQFFYDQSPFATFFFRTDHDPGPFLLVRSWGTNNSGEESIDFFKEFRIALTFIQMPTSGLVVVFVTSDVLRGFSNKGFLECFYGLDEAPTRDLLADVFRRDGLYAALDGDSGFKYDVKIPMDDTCRHLLTREWDRILAYHKRIQLPDYHKATQSVFNLFPSNVDPTLSS